MTEKRLYLDEKHNYVPKEDACWLLIRTLDDDGTLLFEEWINAHVSQSILQTIGCHHHQEYE